MSYLAISNMTNAATRAQVYEDIEARFPNNPRTGIGSADWWAFSPAALPTDTADAMRQWEITPCLICGAPITPFGDGHDEGCMGVSE